MWLDSRPLPWERLSSWSEIIITLIECDLLRARDFFENLYFIKFCSLCTADKYGRKHWYETFVGF